VGYSWCVPTETVPEERRVAGRYLLHSVIGRGGAGTVWRAEDVLLRRMVAVKEVHLPPTLTEDERRVLRERVLREARSAAAVRHSVLVTVFDVVEHEGRPWIVLELVEARTLAAQVADRLLSPTEAARVGIDLLAGLQAVHRAGIQHRDVKPGNVLLEADGRPRLTDFGIASTAGDPALTGTGVLLGSPSYLPPERATGGSGGPESDLWGLAATLYSAVEGQPPYEGSHPLAVLTAVVEGRRRPAERAGELEPLLADLLDRAPEDRPRADEVRRRLVAVAGPDLGHLLLDPRRNPGVRDVGPVLDADPRPGVDDRTPDDRTADDRTADDRTPDDTDPARLSSTAALPVLVPEPAPTRSGSARRSSAARTTAGPAVPSSTRRPGRSARRAALAGAAVLMLVLVALGAVLFTGRSRTSPTTSSSPSPGTGAGTNAGATHLAPASLTATAASAPTPPGWVRYTDPSGWSVAHPADWRRTRLGQGGVDFVPPGTGAYLHVETSSEAPASVTADWIRQEKLLAPRVSNYSRIALSPADGGNGTRAADWEFTFGLAGSPLRAVDRGLVDGSTGYTLYWQTPAPAWGSSTTTLAELFGSFATR
jgi:serine/threonine protein kinase